MDTKCVYSAFCIAILSGLRELAFTVSSKVSIRISEVKFRLNATNSGDVVSSLITPICVALVTGTSFKGFPFMSANAPVPSDRNVLSGDVARSANRLIWLRSINPS